MLNINIEEYFMKSSHTSKKEKMERATVTLQEPEKTEHFEKSQTQSQVSENEMARLRTKLKYVIVDFQINRVDVSLYFDEKSCNSIVEISFNINDIQFKLNSFEPARNLQQTNQWIPALSEVQTNRVASLSSLIIMFCSTCFFLKNITLDFDSVANELCLRFGYLLVDNNEEKGDRIAQVGLDDVEMSKSLQYSALQVLLALDNTDTLKSTTTFSKAS